MKLAAVGAVCGAGSGLFASVGSPPAASGPEGAGIALPGKLGGMTLAELREDYRHRLFDQYLPFWDKGGCDRQLGGFMCELNDDGSVANEEKYIWYQGRGVWVYAVLYNHFGRAPRWLEVARKGTEFMVEHMHAGDGRWYERVRRDGSGAKGLGNNVYGWLFAAAGLVQYAMATGEAKHLRLARQAILAAAEAYDDPGYLGGFVPGESFVDPPREGLRSQGHSMIFMWVLTQLLRLRDDSLLAELQAKHVDLIVNRFWNPDFGIANEYLKHNYARVPGAEGYMYTGHAIETLWMLADEALRLGDRGLLDTAMARLRRLVEMSWDYVFEGAGAEDFLVFATPEHGYGPKLSVKTMWAHCEILIGCMMMLEHTGHPWAPAWYDRVRAFTLRTMPVPGHGVWRQAVDRLGNDVQRIGFSKTRRCNFHQPRYLMLNLLSLDRMLARAGGSSASSSDGSAGLSSSRSR